MFGLKRQGGKYNQDFQEFKPFPENYISIRSFFQRLSKAHFDD